MNRFSPRWINVLLGVWLFASAFLWMHTVPHFNNTWIVGLLAAGAAFGAMRMDNLRFANAALAVWLFASLWALPVDARATFWNNAIVSIIMLISSLTPQMGERLRPQHQHPQHQS